MAQRIHPSNMELTNSTYPKREIILPLGLMEYRIPSMAFNKIVNLWDPPASVNVHKAGTFAQCLRDLRHAKIKISDMERVTENVELTCYLWLEEYERLVDKYAVASKKELTASNKHKNTTSQKEEEPQKGNVELLDQFAMAALTGIVQTNHVRSVEDAATQAYEYAEAMMIERAKKSMTQSHMKGALKKLLDTLDD